MKLPKYENLSVDQTRIYRSLKNAKQRCTNKNHPLYYRYGGRGIKYLIDESKSRIQVVLEQEKAYLKAKRKYPNERISINRIDNDGNYDEANIEWVPQSENTKQMNLDNRGNERMLNGVAAMNKKKTKKYNMDKLQQIKKIL